MPGEQEPTDTGGLTRRQLVTRGAIAGGLVWAAPVIRTTAAYATTANGTERPCQNFYMVVINPDGHALPPPAQRQGNEVPPAIRAWFRDNPGVTVQYPAVAPQLTAVSNEEAAVLLPDVTGPNAAGRQCRMVLGFGRKGNSFAEAFVDPAPPIAVAVGRRLIFPCPRFGNNNSMTASSSDATAVGLSTSTTTTTLPPAIDAASVAAASSGGNGGNNNGGNNNGGNNNGGNGGNGNGGNGNGGNGNGGNGNGGNGNGGNNNGGNGNGNGNGHCFDALYLIYCCPR
jgi:hypothetical protein